AGRSLPSAHARRLRDRAGARDGGTPWLRDHAGGRAPHRRADRPAPGHPLSRARPAARPRADRRTGRPPRRRHRRRAAPLLPADSARPRRRARGGRAARLAGDGGAAAVPWRARVTSASVGNVARMTGAYRVLLRAYPAAFRERFGSGMTQAFADRCRAAQALATAALARFLLRAVSDVLVNATLVRFQQKDRTPMNWQSIGSDIRYAGRMFARNPIFTTLAVAALALGIGANTAIFTIVNGVLLKPLPYGGERDLMMVWSTNSAEHRDRDTVAPLDFLDYRKAGAFADMQATYSFVVGAALRTAAGTEQISATAVTPGMFEMLGRQPALGRTFTAQELQTAVIVSNGFWRTRLGGDPNVLGTVLTIQDHPRTIVGVMPADFVFPYKSMLGPSGFLRSADVEAWLPMAFVNNNNRATGDATLTRSARFLSVVGRLKPGATVAQANGELSGIAKQLSASYPASNRLVGANVVPLHEQAVGALRPALVLLLGGVGFVLLIACVNLANLL